MNTQCVLCDKTSTCVDEIVYVKCELADDACERTHAWCKDCWMSELFDFCPVEKKKKKEMADPCAMCGKIYVDDDKVSLCCVNDDDVCQRRHVWCIFLSC